MDSKTSLGSQDQPINKCPICSKTADKSCSACHAVSYCSPEHQKSHWKTHKEQCCPYSLQESDNLGRHFVASRALKAGALVLMEVPVTYSPQSIFPDDSMVSIPSCLSCCTIMTKNPSRRCSKCKWPICSPQCEKLAHHAENECKIFAKRNVKFPPAVKSYYKGINILRACIQKNKNPKLWLDLLNLQSEYVLPIDSDDSELAALAVKQMKEFKVTELCKTEDWIRMLYVININAFGINMALDNCLVVGGFLFIKGSMLAHSCAPNCTWGISPAPHVEIRVRTTVDVKKGEVLTVAYNQTFNLTGTHNRQMRLRHDAGFMCKCNRCLCPTELGSNASTWVCPKCKNATLLSVNPQHFQADWKCTTCEAVSPGQEIISHIDSLYGLVEICGKDESGKSQLEKMIHEYSGVKLHPNHWVLTEASRKIVQYLGDEKSLDFTDEERNFYIKLCQRLLNVADFISPGISRERAQLQNFIARDQLRKAEKEFTLGKLDREKFQEQLEKVDSHLQNSYLFFKNDHSESIEKGQLGPVACFLLEQMDRVKVLQLAVVPEAKA